MAGNSLQMVNHVKTIENHVKNDFLRAENYIKVKQVSLSCIENVGYSQQINQQTILEFV